MSQKDLELSLLLKMVDRITAPARRVTGVTGKLAKGLSNTKTELRGLNQASKKVEHLKTLKGKLFETKGQLKATSKEIISLKHQMKTAGPKAGKVLRKDLDKSIKAYERITKKQKGLRGRIKQSTAALKKQGITTKSLSQAQKDISNKTDRYNRKLQRQQRLLNLTSKAGSKMRAGMAKMKTAALWGGGAALAGGIALGAPILSKASQFEDFEATLQTIEGSQAKAKKSMDWISDFATKTPFQLGEVTDSFVKLRAYGLNPTGGLMKTLGDTSAAMGKPVAQAVEAMADAVTGENERLKEFGIKAKADGDLFTYNYTDSKGRQKSLSAMKDDRKGIENALRKIWDEKFSGAMDRRSKTWSGLWGNMLDQVTRFQVMIAKSGPFQKLKGHLSGALDKINAMAASGELQQWAERIGQKISNVIDKLAAFGTQVWSAIQSAKQMISPLAEFAGGWGNLGLAVLGVKLLPVIGTISLLSKGIFKLGGGFSGFIGGFKGIGKALIWVGRLVLANPILALLAGIGTAAYFVIKNWDSVKSAVSSALNWIVDILPDWVKDLLGVDSKKTTVINNANKVTSPKKAIAAAAITAGMAVTPAYASPVIAPTSSSPTTMQVEINIHTSPGDDKQAIAEQVRAEMERLQREQQSMQRSQLHD